MYYNLYKNGLIYKAKLTSPSLALTGLDALSESIWELTRVGDDGVERRYSNPLSVVQPNTTVKNNDTLLFSKKDVQLVPFDMPFMREAVGAVFFENFRNEWAGGFGVPWVPYGGTQWYFAIDVFGGSRPEDWQGMIYTTSVMQEGWENASGAQITMGDQPEGVLELYFSWGGVMRPIFRITVNEVEIFRLDSSNCGPAYLWKQYKGIDTPAGNNTYKFEWITSDADDFTEVYVTLIRWQNLK